MSDLLQIDRLALGHENAFAITTDPRRHAGQPATRSMDARIAHLKAAARSAGRVLYKVAAKPGEMAAMTRRCFSACASPAPSATSIPTINGPAGLQGMRGFFAQVKYKKLGETEALGGRRSQGQAPAHWCARLSLRSAPPCLRPRRKAIVDRPWLIDDATEQPVVCPQPCQPNLGALYGARSDRAGG